MRATSVLAPSSFVSCCACLFLAPERAPRRNGTASASGALRRDETQSRARALSSILSSLIRRRRRLSAWHHRLERSWKQCHALSLALSLSFHPRTVWAPRTAAASGRRRAVALEVARAAAAVARRRRGAAAAAASATACRGGVVASDYVVQAMVELHLRLGHGVFWVERVGTSRE